VGDSIEVYVDSGVRRGSDILKAVALGADACSIGRAYLYGLVAAGSPGVGRIIDIFGEELRRTMTLVGVSNISELKARGGEILRDIRHSPEVLGAKVPEPIH
jgi:L-lactate dehydrogenase (cytochrome)